MSPLRYRMASWPEEHHLVAELLDGEEYIGDVRDVDGSLVVTFRRSDPGAQALVLEELLDLLTRVRAEMRPDV